MKERRKDLVWLIPALLAIALTVWYGWIQNHRSTTEVLLVHRNDTFIMTESVEHSDSLTTGSVENVIVKDETGQKISYEELEVGDILLLTSDNYLLLTYPMQYPNIYKIQKTGKSDAERAERVYEEYRKNFAF